MVFGIEKINENPRSDSPRFPETGNRAARERPGEIPGPLFTSLSATVHRSSNNLRASTQVPA
jgi:hypothetical protein